MRRRIARAVLFVYLMLIGLTPVGMEGHASEHEHHGQHGARHGGFVCTWMCAASPFVHTYDPQPPQRFSLSFESPVAYTEPFLKDLSISSFHIRPPPFLLS